MTEAQPAGTGRKMIQGVINLKMENVNHIAIVGTGMIATSLAVLTTGHGYRTTMYALNDELAADSRKVFDGFYAQMVEKGLMTAKQVEICGKYLSYCTEYAPMADADVAFECVVEKLEVKHEVYKALEETCPNLKVICSVSSALVVDKLAASSTKYKDRIIVSHPFNPPHMVPYFEVATGSDTDPAAVDFAVALLKALDRKPVVLKKCVPGFIGNRLQFALWREAVHLVESGVADPRDIDTCLMYSFCPRYSYIGMFEHFDNGGLTLNYSTCENIFPDLSNAAEPPASVKEHIDKGELGVKTGKGFYEWPEADVASLRERITAPYWRFFNWELPTE